MEDFGAYYAIIFNDPELRRALIREAEQSRVSGEASRTSRLLRRCLAQTLRGLASRVEPNVPVWSDATRPQAASVP
jgi:hypothetical protein